MSESTMNGTGNEGGSVTDGLPENERTRAYLKAKRDFYGADTPIGHRCSNLMKQLEAYAGAFGDQKRDLEKLMALQMRELEALLP